MKIKILHLSQSFGGVETYLRHILEYINPSKFEQVVIAPPNQSFKAFCQQKNITYYEVDMARGFDPKIDFKAYFRIKRLIIELNVDIVHLHSSKAGFLGRILCSRLEIKSIFTPNGISYMSFKGWKRIFFIGIEVWLKAHTYKFLGCSYSESLRMQNEIGIPQEKINSILNAIPIPLNYADKRVFGYDSNLRIGSISRLTYQKNPLLFVEIAYKLKRVYPNSEFSILGAGLNDHLKDQTISLIKEYNLTNSFKILDWGNENTSKEYLKSIDIFILPSIFEGLPFSLLEAMAIGTIAITSKCDGCNDVIQNGVNGFSCITSDDFVNSIVNIIDNQMLQRSVREQAFEYITNKHNVQAFSIQLENYYQSIAEEDYIK